MSKKKEEIVEIEKKYPSLILGLDISTACIGISIVYDDGINEPEIIKITHVVPKIDKKIKGIEALILRKEIFEKEFLEKIVEEKVPLNSLYNLHTMEESIEILTAIYL
jgi:hypothetical protein